MFEHHSAKMENQAKFDRLVQLGKNTGYLVRFNPTKYRNNWPSASLKPYAIAHADGSHITSFGNLAAVEKYIRDRAAC